MIPITPVAPRPVDGASQQRLQPVRRGRHLAEIFRRIGTTNKQCFEVGAADGKWFSNSRKLIDEGWSRGADRGRRANWPELDKLDAPAAASTSFTARPSRPARTRSTRS
jgi:hypothetical protein